MSGMQQIQEIKTPDLQSSTDAERSTITVKLTGSAETPAVSELSSFLDRIHSSALEAKVGEVVIDMRALEFMNSSCFKTLVHWIGVLQEVAADSQYKVRFVHDEKKHWQSRSLGALACFAVDLIRVEAA
jgi:hypothetical protein